MITSPKCNYVCCLDLDYMPCISFYLENLKTFNFLNVSIKKSVNRAEKLTQVSVWWRLQFRGYNLFLIIDSTGGLLHPVNPELDDTIRRDGLAGATAIRMITSGYKLKPSPSAYTV